VDTYVVVGALNAFHISGALFAIWALTLTTLGLRRENFPRTHRQAWLVGATSVLLAAGTISSAIIVGALEGNEKGGGEAAGKPAKQTAAAAAGGELRLSADPSGQLKFDKSALEAREGTITIAMTNASSVPHDVSIEGKGVDKKGKIVRGGGTSTVKAKLKSGSYTFYCSVDGHRQAGMKGTLTVR
jgi:plastocyanin